MVISVPWLVKVLQSGRGIFLTALTFLSVGTQSLAENFADFYGEKKAAIEPPIHSGALQVKIPLNFTLPKRISIRKERILLKDIADCEGPHDLCEEAQTIDFGAAPIPGRNLTLTSRQLKEVISQEISAADVGTTGADIVTVEAESQTISKDTVAENFKLAIDEVMKHHAIKINILSLSMSSQLKVRPGAYHIEFPAIDQAVKGDLDWLVSSQSGMHRMEALYVSEDENTRTPFALSVRVDVYLKYPILKSDKKVHETLRAEDFVIDWVKKTAQSDRWISHIDDLKGMVLRRPLAKGATVTIDSMEKMQLVKRGQKIKLNFTRNGLHMTGTGKALENGSVGDWIELLYPATGKKLSGRITEDASVEVAL